ncbi:MAG TPA: DUF433 domain-containing protein [Fibrobacteria bacterium]|nr:DUF433 domain-containing protein [Fibrobacteria bacterium]
MNKRISINPNICHGKPVVAGTRVLVSNVLASLAAGETTAEILENYPTLTEEDIRAALEFGSELAQFESLPYEKAS